MAALRILILVVAYTSCANAACNSLTSSFEQYMNCIKSKVGPQFKQLELDYQNDMAEIATQAFGGSSKGQCQLTLSELKTDVFGPDSIPLANCGTCKLIAKVAIQLVNSVDKQTADCASGIIRDKLAENLASCVRAKTQLQFSTPDVPNFDEEGFNLKAEIQESLSRCINMETRSLLCERKNRAGWAGTSKALASWLQNGGFATTCAISDSCNSGSCSTDVNTAHKATCACLQEGGAKVKSEIEKLGSRLVNLIFEGKNCTLFASQLSSSKRSYCSGEVVDRLESVIKEHAGEPQPDGCRRSDVLDGDTPPISGLSRKNLQCACYWSVRDALRAKSDYSQQVTDWYTVVTDVKDKCLGGETPEVGGIKKGLTIDKAIFWGCNRIIKQSSMRGLMAATREMWTGIQFIGDLFDCAVQRVSRFCPCQ